MEQHCECTSRIGQAGRRHRSWLALVLIAAFSLADSAPAVAQDECTTVKDCAQDMVDLANDLKAENVALAKRIAELDEALKNQAQAFTKELDDRFAAIRVGNESYTSEKGNSTTKKCPKGTFMIGARVQSNPGGRNGMIAWIHPICRTLGK